MGSARPTIDEPIATDDPRWKMAEHDAQRKRQRECDRQGGARQLDLLERLCCEEPRVVGDEAKRVAEGARDDHARSNLVQGASARRSATRSASHASARAIASPPAA